MVTDSRLYNRIRRQNELIKQRLHLSAEYFKLSLVECYAGESFGPELLLQVSSVEYQTKL